MKFIHFIFSLYITFLACYPCSDDATCVDEKRTGTVVTVSGHAHSGEEIDVCSPFCICSCCRSQINQPGYFHFEASSPAFMENNSVLLPDFSKSISHAIWQPPRLI